MPTRIGAIALLALATALGAAAHAAQAPLVRTLRSAPERPGLEVPIGVDPDTGGCLDEPVDAGARFTRHFLRCQARHARSSPEQLEACTTASNDLFSSEFETALRSAQRSGFVCRGDIEGARQALLFELEALQDAIDGDLDLDSKAARRYRAALYKVAARAVSSILRAEARHEDHLGRLERARAQIEARVARAMFRANRKAVFRGLDSTTSVDELLDAIDAIVEANADIADEFRLPGL